MKLIAPRLIVTLVVLFTGISTASAQERLDAAGYRTEASVMHSMLRDIGELGKAGLLVDFGKEVKTIGSLQASAIGEFAVNKFSGDYDPTYVQAAGGLRIGRALARVRPFGQIVVGVQHELGASGLVVQPGAGLNIRTGRNIDARVQVDFPVLWWEGHRYEQFRFSAGVGIPLGRN